MKFLQNKKSEIRFLIFGAINTLFGYLNSLFIFYTFKSFFNPILLILIINFINIKFSFSTLKYFVFKSKGNWFFEFTKSLILYAGILLFNSFVLWFWFEIISLKFYIASFFATITSIIFSYYGNKKFTFRS